MLKSLRSAIVPLLAMVFFCAPVCHAQLSQEQKVTDFLALAGMYDKQYAPVRWVNDVFDFNLRELDPWLDQVHDSKSDLEFYDICVRYVASLHDFHDEFTLPSIYEAFLPFTVDIYSGKVLVDSTDPALLNPQTYPFGVGDEMIAVDGVKSWEWIRKLGPYAVNGQGNPVSRDRLAAATILDRYQGWYTFASNVQPGQSAAVAIKSAATGVTTTYSIPWQVIFIPLLEEGPVPNPSSSSLGASPSSTRAGAKRSMFEAAKAAKNSWGIWNGAPAKVSRPALTQTAAMRQASHSEPVHSIAGSIDPFDSQFPLFNAPPGFQLRLGANPTDNFVSGTFPAGNLTVGFIRIPTFEPADEAAALQQFAGEMAYFQQNTSGLVIDLMGNGGGDLCYTNNVLQYLFPQPFQTLGFQLRATEQWILYFEETLFSVAQAGAPQSVLDNYVQDLIEVQNALAKDRTLTPPLSICSDTLTYPPATDQSGNVVAYTGPILLLTNNFTASGAEIFSATLQDAQRAYAYGVRTSGGGGNVVGFQFNVGPYSEGSERVTQSMARRNHDVSTPGLPSAPYIENIGVYPDVHADYQTIGNLLTGGQPFVNGFIAAISNLIANGKP
jgi:peptidase S41-like protein/PDZ domain-containing protein